MPTRVVHERFLDEKRSNTARARVPISGYFSKGNGIEVLVRYRSTCLFRSVTIQVAESMLDTSHAA